MKNKLAIAITFLMFALHCSYLAAQSSAKPRTIITTDGEIDDVDSYIRMLLYSNEFQIEGLIYSSSMWHYKGDGNGTKFTSEMEMTRKLYGEKTDLRWPGTQWMDGLIGAYDKVYPKLSTHAEGYPTADYLRSVVRVGNIDFEGEMERETAGSELIKRRLLDNNDAPIYLQAWGGTNTIARALKTIEEQYKNTPLWEQMYQKVSKKAIIYAILDQDATYKKYVEPNWPDIKVYYNANQFWCLAYPWKKAVAPPQHYLLEGKFMSDNIIHQHGPLTSMYYSWGDGQKQVGDDEHTHGDPLKMKGGMWGDFEKYDFISEGDSPAFLHLVDVGLGNLERPDYGGWGGRLVQSTTVPSRWEDGPELAEMNPLTQKMEATYPQVRWLEAIQMDFAARADWCVTDFKNANHPPKLSLKHAHSLKVKAGKTVQLEGEATDPDGQTLQAKWWQYEEAGTFKCTIKIKHGDSLKASFKMPKDIKPGETIHLILEVKDSGTPQLTRYQRVVVSG
ncbi:MAG: DUF1593 domain-containing protein [Saprospiraceae bacterium]|nr:DUF1593 domain-containing protein [Saprospiraceae bacterium]